MKMPGFDRLVGAYTDATRSIQVLRRTAGDLCRTCSRHLLHRIRLNCQFGGVVQHSPGFRVQIHRPIVVNDVAGVLGIAGELTEEPSVGDSSVATFIDDGDCGRDRLFLHPGQWFYVWFFAVMADT